MAFFKSSDEFWKSDLSNSFLKEITHGEWSLFAGAGFSVGAQNSQNQNPPLGNALRDRIATDFLNIPQSEVQNQPLSRIASVANDRDAKEFHKFLSLHYVLSGLVRHSWRDNLSQKSVRILA